MIPRSRIQGLAFSLALVCAALAPGRAAAQVPDTLTQQGALYAADGTPLSGSYSIEYALYTDPANGTPVWSETVEVQVEDGFFVVELGTVSPFGDIFDGTALYLGMSIDGDDEVVPRERITSVPYALVAGNAVGAITPSSVSVGGTIVIDEDGGWVGDPTGLVGPQGPVGETGPQGPVGETGANGLTPSLASVDPGPECPAGGVSLTLLDETTYVCNGEVGPQGPVGPMGPQGPVGPVGPQGPVGPTGATGAVGPQGPVGPTGATGAVGPAGATGATGAVGPQGPIGPVGPQGPPGSFALPAATNAVFGTGPITVASGTTWRLDAVSGSQLQLASTSATFQVWSAQFPVSCVETSPTGSANVGMSYLFTFSATTTMNVPLCSLGSMARLTVSDATSGTFNEVSCVRFTSNHIRCVRLY